MSDLITRLTIGYEDSQVHSSDGLQLRGPVEDCARLQACAQLKQSLDTLSRAIKA